MLRIQKMLESPALETRAAVREHRDHVARFHAHIVFSRLADDRRSRWRPNRRRRGCRGSGGGRAGYRRRHGRRASSRRGRSGRGGRSRCRFWDRFDEQRLPRVQNDKRQENREENSSFHLERHRIVPGRAERVTTDETAYRQPATLDDAVTAHRLGGIVRACGQEPTRPGELWRDGDFVASNHAKCRPDGPGGGRRAFCNRLQWCSGWRREGRAWV